MLSTFSRHRRARIPLPADEHLRFRKFAYAKSRHPLRLLMFCMPLLFAIGWVRDLSVLGDAAHWTLLLRLGLVFGLLILAGLTWLSGFSRSAEVFGALYALLFSMAIATTSAIEPARLSLTHVPIMLMLIILLPFSISMRSAIATCAGIALPMIGLLSYVGAPPALWAAYTLFFVAGCAIGFTQRAAQLTSAMEIFLHRERLLKRLHRHASGATAIDLTDRDGWETRAHYLHRHQREAQQALSVIRLDLDHVEQVRDQHGQAVADALLKKTTSVMRDCLRHGDLLARMDGKAFVILLPDSDADTAVKVAERIRTAIERMSGHGGSGPRDIAVTTCVGITQTREREPLKEATGRADAAMHEARQRGRNRVVLG